MRNERLYYVYMMTSNNRRAVYIGVTNTLLRRVLEHRHGRHDGFIKRYHCINLVYYDSTSDVWGAIEAEKRIKKWRREKKNALIYSQNPDWRDLFSDISG